MLAQFQCPTTHYSFTSELGKLLISPFQTNSIANYYIREWHNWVLLHVDLNQNVVKVLQKNILTKYKIVTNYKNDENVIKHNSIKYEHREKQWKKTD